VPCRVSADEQAHTSSEENSDETLCGKDGASKLAFVGERPTCGPCGRQLLTRILHAPNAGGMTAFDVSIRR